MRVFSLCAVLLVAAGAKADMVYQVVPYEVGGHEIGGWIQVADSTPGEFLDWTKFTDWSIDVGMFTFTPVNSYVNTGIGVTVDGTQLSVNDVAVPAFMQIQSLSIEPPYEIFWGHLETTSAVSIRYAGEDHSHSLSVGSIPVAAVPEPGAWLMMTLALVGALVARRWR